MGEWCSKHSDIFDYFKRPWEGPVQEKSKDGRCLGVGMNTAHAVFTLLTEEKSMMSMMSRLLRWGGDTDSVAAVTWGIAGCRHQNEELPHFLLRDLELCGNPKYGYDTLIDLGTKLMAAKL